MAAIYFDSPSNDQYDEHQFFSPSDHPHHEHQFLSPNSQASSSSNSLNCHLFFNPISTNDQHEVFDRELHPSPKEDDSFISQAYDEHHVDNGELRLSLWKGETYNHLNDKNQVKWMSSKMRVMFNMKNTNPAKLNALRSTATELKLEDRRDRKEPTSSSPMEETSSINHIPVRVCSDCNTTKTPLWRSGPQGPKSLCNACGIRQRKARKAMAMAAAMAAETRENAQNVFTGKPKLLKPAKILHKDYKRTNIGNLGKYKKRQFSKQRNTNPSSSSLSPTRKNCLEEFLVNLSKNLAFHPVFPQDEKEAAILLMAISCGYVHQ